MKSGELPATAPLPGVSNVLCGWGGREGGGVRNLGNKMALITTYQIPQSPSFIVHVPMLRV